MRTGALIGKTTLIVTAALALIVGALGLSGSVSAAEQAPTTVAAQQESGSAWLGVGVQDSADGVSVVEVAAGSPADDAGLRVGDVITQIDDTEIDVVDTLLSALADYAPGDEVTVTTSYRGVETDHSVTLGERPADLDTQPSAPNQPNQGLQMGTLDFLGLNLTLEAGGLHVNSIAADSPLADSGLEAGDVITSIGGLSVADLNSPRDLLQLLRQGGTLEVVIERGGEEQTLEIDLMGLGDVEVPNFDFDFNFDDFGMGGMMGEMGQHFRALLGVDVTWTDAGLELTSLDADSPLVDLGFEEGDVVTAVNGTALTDLNLSTVESFLSSIQDSQTLTVTVQRNGEAQDIEVDLSALDLPDFSGMHFGMMDDMMGGMGQIAQNRLGVDVTWTDAGLEFTSLDADSPLVDLGFEEGDVVTAINGTALADLNLSMVESFLSSMQDSQTLTVTVQRNGETQDIDVDLSALDFTAMMPFISAMPFHMGEGMMGQGYGYGYGYGMMQPPTQLGVQYRVLTADIAAQEGLDVEQGALIEQVYDGTPAADAGLQAGDVVTEVDGEAVDAEHTLSDRLSDYEAGDTVTLTVLRNGDEQSIDVTLGARNYGMQFEFRNDFGRGNGGQPFQMPRRDGPQRGQAPRSGQSQMPGNQQSQPNSAAPGNGNGNGSQQPANSGTNGQPA